MFTARIPSAPLKTLIQSLASRTNYGLTLDDIDDLPEGVKAVPTGLLIQVWEVKDEDLWVDEMRARLEKRKAERDEVRRRVPACARQSAALLTRAWTWLCHRFAALPLSSSRPSRRRSRPPC